MAGRSAGQRAQLAVGPRRRDLKALPTRQEPDPAGSALEHLQVPKRAPARDRTAKARKLATVAEIQRPAKRNRGEQDRDWAHHHTSMLPPFSKETLRGSEEVR